MQKWLVWAWEIKTRMSFHHSCANLKFHKRSFEGVFQDFIISFDEERTDIFKALNNTYDLFQQLIQTNFKNRTVCVRFVAKINFRPVNQETRKTDERSYHFPSNSCEEVYDVQDFYERHMTKIAECSHDFNEASNLLIKNIAHIHILLSLL